MQISDAIDTLNHRLLDLAERRARAAQESEGLTREQGATIGLLRDHYGQSQAASARHLGLSVGAVSDIVAKARDAGTQVLDPINQCLRLNARKAVDYLYDHNDEIDQVAAAFAENDLLYLTKLHPSAFAEPGSTHIWIPHMLWHLAAAGEWIGITGVNVGYGGSGPAVANSALAEVVPEPGLAAAISGHRLSFVDLTGKSRNHFQHWWPMFPLSRLGYHGTHVSTSLSLEGTPSRDPIPPRFDTDGSGIFPTEPTGSPLERWIAMLNSSERPSWLDGPRRGRLYLDRGAADEDGFREPPLQLRGGSPRIVIEQGDLQLQLRAYAPLDKNRYLSDEEYQALDLLELYPARMRSRDSQARWIRALRKQLGTTQPARIALGDDIIYTEH